MPPPDPRRDGGAYEQPSPRVLYVHDDLTAEVERRVGPGGPAHALVAALLDCLRAEGDRVVILTLAQQLDRVVGQGPHAPFEAAIAIGAAGERVARQLDARTGWFPRVHRVGLTREEDGRGGYVVVSTDGRPLAGQLADVRGRASLAVVDDTVFSGLTMQTVLDALGPDAMPRTRVFCLRAVAESLAAIAAR
jgi:hypothetical protein